MELTDYVSWMKQYYGYLAEKRVKTFKKRSDTEPYVTLDNTDIEEQSKKDHGGTESEESRLKLIIDIWGETKSATDKGE